MEKKLLELSDNVHPSTNGEPWGWIKISGTRLRIATYSGIREKEMCQKLVEVYNQSLSHSQEQPLTDMEKRFKELMQDEGNLNWFIKNYAPDLEPKKTTTAVCNLEPTTPEELAVQITEFPNLWGAYSIADAVYRLIKQSADKVDSQEQNKVDLEKLFEQKADGVLAGGSCSAMTKSRFIEVVTSLSNSNKVDSQEGEYEKKCNHLDCEDANNFGVCARVDCAGYFSPVEPKQEP